MDADEPGITRFKTVTDDPGRIDELTRVMYGARVRLERHDGRVPSLGLAQAGTVSFGVQRVTWDVDGWCSTDQPVGQFLGARVRRGAYGLDQGGGAVQYVAGETFAFDPTRQIDCGVLGADIESVSLELPVLEAVAAQVAPWSRGRLDHRRSTPVTAPLARAFDEVLTDTARVLSEDDSAAGSALIRAGLLFRLAATACAAFAIVGPEGPGRAVPARAVRRAVSYIEDHLAEPITVGDVAEAAGLSTRGLQAAFIRVLDLSPSAYLRRARLHAARRDLLDADDLTTVAGVARRWGFNHLGRFADGYRIEFDELPSATLRT